MTERRLRKLLGLSPGEATILTDRARMSLGRRAYAVRLGAFLIATTPGLRLAIPRGLRRAAIRPLVYGIIPGVSENLLYAGARREEEGTSQ